MQDVGLLLVCYGLSFGVLFSLFAVEARRFYRESLKSVVPEVESISRYAALLRDDSTEQQ